MYFTINLTVKEDSLNNDHSKLKLRSIIIKNLISLVHRSALVKGVIFGDRRTAFCVSLGT